MKRQSKNMQPKHYGGVSEINKNTIRLFHYVIFLYFLIFVESIHFSIFKFVM